MALLGISALAFVLFCFSLGGFITQFLDASLSTSWVSYIAIFIFFLLALSGVVFAAVIKSTYWFTLIPLLYPVLFGFLLFQAWLHFLLIFGVPFAFVFLVIKRTIGNRVRVHFSTDIRRPITTAYLILFFFTSFAVAPVADEFIKANAGSLVMKMIPENVEIDGESVALDYSIQDLINKEIEDNIALCQGNAECEARLREEVATQVEAQLLVNPLFGGMDATSERSVAEELVEKFVNDFENSALFDAVEAYGIPRSAVWGFLIFLIISPFTILFSFFSVLFMAVIFDLLKLFRVFRVEKQNVRQDIIC